MSGFLRPASLVVCAALLGGCAVSGPRLADVQQSIPSLSAEQGRIWFYRESSFAGSALRPSVHLNGEKVGESQPGGVWYVDRPAGEYTVSVTTEVEKTLAVKLSPREEKFVRTSVGIGWLVGRIHPELVERKEAEAAMRELSFIDLAKPVADSGRAAAAAAAQ